MINYFKQHRWIHFPIIGALLLAMLIPTAASTVNAQSSCGSTYTVTAGDTMGSIALKCGVSLASLEAADTQITNPNLIYPGQVITIPTSAIIPLTGAPTTVLAPASGSSGTQVIVAGTGWPVDTKVTISLEAQGATSPASTFTVTTESSGRLSAVITIPSNAVAGTEYVVTVTSETSGGPSSTVNFPVVTSPPSGLYTVVSGDTLTGVAQDFGTTVSALVDANPTLAPTSLLTAGQQIYIPGSTLTINGQKVYIVKPGDFLSSIALNENVTLPALISANPSIPSSGLIYSGQHIIIPSGTIPITGGPSLLLSPTFGAAGTSVVVSGTGFPTSTALNISAGPQGAAAMVTTTASTDSSGKFSVNLTVPSSAQNGTWVFSVATTTSGGPSASVNFQVGHIAVSPSGSYTVVSGDTLGGIAIHFNTTVNALQLANPQITNANVIEPGEVIYLPGATLTINGKKVYIVKQGDYMGLIASNQGVTLSALEAANPQITDQSLIFPGQRVNIP